MEQEEVRREHGDAGVGCGLRGAERVDPVRVDHGGVKMAKKIKVVIKRPHEKPYVTYISNTLENMQKHVEGYI